MFKRFLIVISFLVCIVSNLDAKNTATSPIASCNSPMVHGYKFKSIHRIYKKAAIVADSQLCPKIGKEILLKNGSAVDAMIAVALCNGISNPNNHGIGGGHFMLIYLKEQNKFYAIDARECAPIKSTSYMFTNASKPDASLVGGLATGVPGEIAGFWAAHQIGGKLPWKDLFQPTIDLCNNGLPVSKKLGLVIAANEANIRKNRGLVATFIDQFTNQPLKEGETIKYPLLAKTFQAIADGGSKAFYDGELSPKIVREINSKGGIFTLDDLRNYKPKVTNSISVNLKGNYQYNGMPPPSSGILISFILNLMTRFNLTKQSTDSTEKNVLFHHRLVEAFKHAFARRSYLGDPDFVNISKVMTNLTNPNFIDAIFHKINDSTTFPQAYYEPSWLSHDNGTSPMSVIGPNGDAVSMTSTINTDFGALYSGLKTGIIYNNEMDDFSRPGAYDAYGVPSFTTNFIVPGKRPMSSMSPSIILDQNGNVRLAIGGEGGTHIISSVSKVAIKNLYVEQDLASAVNEPHLHHQLSPDNIFFESGIPERLYPQRELIAGLEAKNHKASCDKFGFSIVEGIARLDNGNLLAVSDYRKGGHVDGF